MSTDDAAARQEQVRIRDLVTAELCETGLYTAETAHAKAIELAGHFELKGDALAVRDGAALSLRRLEPRLLGHLNAKRFQPLPRNASDTEKSQRVQERLVAMGFASPPKPRAAAAIDPRHQRIDERLRKLGYDPEKLL